jgi:hypothetical protein
MVSFPMQKGWNQHTARHVLLDFIPFKIKPGDAPRRVLKGASCYFSSRADQHSHERNKLSGTEFTIVIHTQPTGVVFL